MDVLFLHTGQFGVDEVIVALFLDVHLDRRRLLCVSAHIDGPDKKAAEQVVERIESGNVCHDWSP